MRNIKIPKNILGLNSIYFNKNLLFLFYNKYNVNVFIKNIT